MDQAAGGDVAYWHTACVPSVGETTEEIDGATDQVDRQETLRSDDRPCPNADIRTSAGVYCTPGFDECSVYVVVAVPAMARSGLG